uniref:bZIP transcription factor n=1 Tax=Persicitalea sp. TaxID=3100273 RepID=UPI003594214F
RSNTTGFDNSFTGFQAGYSNTVGSRNSFTGYYAGYYNTTGGENTFTGYQAGRSNTTGFDNSFMGTFAGYNNTTGGYNSFTGLQAGYYNTTGNRNSFTGTQSGLANTTGDNNSFFGTYADATGPNKANLERATALGYRALVAVNNGLVLGDTSNVKVGIGTAYPNQRLTIRGNINYVAYDNSMMLKGQPFLHFNEHESLALGLGAELPADAEKTLVLGSSESAVQIPGLLSAYQPQAGQFLSVNQSGRLVLSQPRVQVAHVADWSDKVFEEGYALQPLDEVEAFVKKNKHLPGVPSAAAMVAEGMKSTAFNAKLLEKIEELTLYVVELEKRNEVQQQEIEKLADTNAEVKLLREEMAELKALIRRGK